VRASFGNPKGYGPFSAASPKSVVPSTWRSVDKKEPRIRNQVTLVRLSLSTVARSSITNDNANKKVLVSLLCS
jgi:hypothetical protein